MGMSGSFGSAPSTIDIKQHVYRLIKNAKLSTNHNELNKVIEDLSNVVEALEIDERTLEIMEAVALTSNDENIIALREELFTTVKLVHGDKINEAVTKMKMDLYTTSTTFSVSGLSSHNITTGGTSLSITSPPPLQVNGVDVPNCEQVEDIVEAVLDKRSIWKRAKTWLFEEKE